MKILFTWPLDLFWVLSEWGEKRDDTISLIAVVHGQSIVVIACIAYWTFLVSLVVVAFSALPGFGQVIFMASSLVSVAYAIGVQMNQEDYENGK